jgi:small subunit ribosomal protein S18
MPAEVLKQFREDVPASEAENARIASTRGIWDATDPKANSVGDGGIAELSPADLAVQSAWSAVDERTMDPYYFARMRRQRAQTDGSRGAGQNRVGAGGAALGRWGASGALQPQRKRQCRLSDPRGRVRVDFREVGVIKEFLNDHGKIIGRRKSGLSAKAQRKMARCVKTARHMALLHPEPKPGLTLEEMEKMAIEMGAEMP